MAAWRDDARDLDWGVIAKKGEKFTGTAGDDHIVGTGLDDLFKVGQGGNDTLEGGNGNDTFRVRASLTNEDRIDGGDGLDEVKIAGNYSHNYDLSDGTLRNVEYLYFKGPGADGPSDYSITLPEHLEHDYYGHLGLNVSVYGIDTTGESNIILDGSNATEYILNITGSNGDDVLIGGTYEVQWSSDWLIGDEIRGGFGQDTMTGGPSRDTYHYSWAGESSPARPDIITDFEHGDHDEIDLSQIETSEGRPLHFGTGGDAGEFMGDVLVSYDAGQNATFINVYTNRGSTPDMVIELSGDHSDLAADDFDFDAADPYGQPPGVTDIPQIPELTPASQQIAIV